jgi:hypothetical protein
VTVKRNFGSFLELLIGRWRPSVATAVARLGLGVLCPGIVLAYALRSLFVRQIYIPSRTGLREIVGLPAVAVGVIYACVAMIIYVYVCWDDHPHLSGLRDSATRFLLLAIFIALAAAFGLVFL